MKKNVLLGLLILAVSCSFAQDAFEKKWLVVEKDSLPYRLLLPPDYNPKKEYPLILFLHGAGERGNDNEKQLVHGSKLFLREDVRRDHPAIVVFPQCPQNSYWSNVQFIRDSTGKRTFVFQKNGEPTKAMSMVQELLRRLFKEYEIDDDKVYVGGLSMGGMGTFELVARQPKMFAAAFPICGGGNTENAKKLRKTAWWVFHGEKDDIVPPHHSVEMVEALKKKGASVRFTLYPDANHNSWDPAFAEKELIPWLFSHDR